MADVYMDLAKKLDELPQGFPATESGLELKILRKIFTPEEASMALQIKPIPETVEAIAERLGKTLPEMQAIQLVRKPESEQDTPPTNLIDWSVQRAATRGVKLELN